MTSQFFQQNSSFAVPYVHFAICYRVDPVITVGVIEPIPNECDVCNGGEKSWNDYV
jgi:hypothetical protein